MSTEASFSDETVARSVSRSRVESSSRVGIESSSEAVARSRCSLRSELSTTPPTDSVIWIASSETSRTFDVSVFSWR